MAPKKPFYKVRRTVRAEKTRAEKIGAETLAPNRSRRTVRAEPTPTREQRAGYERCSANMIRRSSSLCQFLRLHTPK